MSRVVLNTLHNLCELLLQCIQNDQPNTNWEEKTTDSNIFYPRGFIKRKMSLYSSFFTGQLVFMKDYKKDKNLSYSLQNLGELSVNQKIKAKGRSLHCKAFQAKSRTCMPNTSAQQTTLFPSPKQASTAAKSLPLTRMGVRCRQQDTQEILTQRGLQFSRTQRPAGVRGSQSRRPWQK